MNNFIRLHLTYKVPLIHDGGSVVGENFWALQISLKTAKINNIPIGTDEFTLGDLVEFDANGEIVRVLERGARTRLAAYDPGPSDATAFGRYLAIQTFLAQHDVLTEGIVHGSVALSVPNDLDDTQLAALCARCPVALTPSLVLQVRRNFTA